MADLRDEVCRLGRCTPEQLASSSQGRKCGRWRQALVYVGRTYYRFPMKGLTRLLRRDISAGSQIMRRLGEEGNGHSEIEQLLNSVSL
jgi:hypothetical protein